MSRQTPLMQQIDSPAGSEVRAERILVGLVETGLRRLRGTDARKHGTMALVFAAGHHLLALRADATPEMIVEAIRKASAFLAIAADQLAMKKQKQDRYG